MIVNMTALDVDKLYNEGHAQEFSRIVRIKDPDLAARLFITMKTIVLIYVYDMQFRAQHDLSEASRRLKHSYYI